MNENINVINGFISLLLFGYFSGIIIQTGLKMHPERLLNIFEKSIFALYFSWLVVFVSFFGGLNDITPLLLAVVLILHLKNGSEYVREEMAIFVRLLFVGIITAYILDINGNDLIFKIYDPMVSLNEWALQLYENNYRPFEAGYPVFFPGLWSLIYKAQGSPEFWIISKISLIIPLIISMVLAFLIRKKNKNIGHVLIGFIILIAIDNPRIAFAGYMDAPIFFGVFCILAIILYICLIGKKEGASLDRHLTTLSFTVGVVSIIKQPGYLFLALFIGLVAILAYNKKIKITHALTLSVISITPIVMFFLMFHVSGNIGNIFGNLDILTKLSVNHSIDIVDRVFKFNDVVKYNIPLIALVFSIISLFVTKGLIRVFNISALLLFFIGLLMTVYCCSYSSRNFYWLLAPLIVSSSTAFSHQIIGDTWKTYITPKLNALASNKVINLQLMISACVDYLLSLENFLRTRKLFSSIVFFVIIMVSYISFALLPEALIESNLKQRDVYPGKYIVDQHLDNYYDNIILSYDRSIKYAPSVFNFGTPAEQDRSIKDTGGKFLVNMSNASGNFSSCIDRKDVGDEIIVGRLRELDGYTLTQCAETVAIFGYSGLLKGKKFTSELTEQDVVYNKNGYTLILLKEK